MNKSTKNSLLLAAICLLSTVACMGRTITITDKNHSRGSKGGTLNWFTPSDMSWDLRKQLAGPKAFKFGEKIDVPNDVKKFSVDPMCTWQVIVDGKTYDVSDMLCFKSDNNHSKHKKKSQ